MTLLRQIAVLRALLVMPGEMFDCESRDIELLEAHVANRLPRVVLQSKPKADNFPGFCFRLGKTPGSCNPARIAGASYNWLYARIPPLCVTDTNRHKPDYEKCRQRSRAPFHA